MSERKEWQQGEAWLDRDCVVWEGNRQMMTCVNAAIAALRASIPGIKREAWEAGRDAAAHVADASRHPDYSAESEDWIEGAEFVARAIRVLQPPEFGDE